MEKLLYTEKDALLVDVPGVILNASLPDEDDDFIEAGDEDTPLEEGDDFEFIDDDGSEMDDFDFIDDDDDLKDLDSDETEDDVD